MLLFLRISLISWLFLHVLTVSAIAQTRPDSLIAIKPSPLFDSTQPVAFTLTADLRTLVKDRGEKPVAHSAVLTYVEKQTADTLPLTLTVRGNFRRIARNCTFPPLLVDFKKKKTKHTLFARQNKLKLVTHCQVDEWVVREFLVYKLYNLLTDLSFRAQLARVTYADSLRKRAPETHWGFLLEDDSDLAKRNHTKPSPLKKVNMQFTDSLTMATVAVFEYMIGNTDWSVRYLHNVRLFGNGQTNILPVAYDFDHAGIVEATYAKPDEQLGIQSVRQRTYRGITYSPALFRQVFARFRQAKPQMYALYQTNGQLDKSYVKRTLKYLDDFYTLLDKPSSLRNVFVQPPQ